MLSSELKDTLLQFAEAKITISKLEDWLIPRLPRLLKSPDSPDADIIAEVELGLVEISSGRMTADELRDELKRELSKYPLLSASEPTTFRNVSGTANSTNNIPQLTLGAGISMSKAL